jgi:hypothetical protein
MHFKGFAQIAARENGDRLTDDIDRLGYFFGRDDVNRSHDGSPGMRALVEYIHSTPTTYRDTSPSVRAISTPIELFSGRIALLR